mmetsp:Transcript_2065/g.4873  ORF Transcript_2065/g.4873 Transcript_2065/m.4873 type:complete len:215 (-) Transcript_2065:388-1032(-)
MFPFRTPFAKACVAIVFPFPTAMVSGFGNERSYESTAAASLAARYAAESACASAFSIDDLVVFASWSSEPAGFAAARALSQTALTSICSERLLCGKGLKLVTSSVTSFRMLFPDPATAAFQFGSAPDSFAWSYTSSSLRIFAASASPMGLSSALGSSIGESPPSASFAVNFCAFFATFSVGLPCGWAAASAGPGWNWGSPAATSTASPSPATSA